MTENPMVRLAEIMSPLNAAFGSDDARKVAVVTARDTLASVVEQTPDFLHARYFLGITESILGNNAAAAEHFKAILPYAPSLTFSAEIHYNLGVSLKVMGDPFAKAAFEFARDLTDDPALAELAREALR